MVDDLHYPLHRLTVSRIRGAFVLGEYLAARVRMLCGGPLAGYRFGWAWLTDMRGARLAQPLDPLDRRAIEAVDEEIIRRMPEGRLAVLCDQSDRGAATTWMRFLARSAALNHVQVRPFEALLAAICWLRPEGMPVPTAAAGSARLV